MGIPYEHFLMWLFAGIAAFVVKGASDHMLRNSLEAQAVRIMSRFRGLWVAFDLSAWVAFFALIAIGFLSLRWYVALGWMFGGWLASSLLASVVLFRRGVDGIMARGRIAGAIAIAIACFLWAQRITH